MNRLLTIALLTLALVATPAFAAPKKGDQQSRESEYYKIITIPIPEGDIVECGGMEIMPDKTLAVSTRRGDIWFITGAYDDPPTNVKFKKWATGMHETMGLAYNPKDGYLYTIQRGEITRLKDTDGRGKANVYETYCDEWGVSGDYHEYPWMSKFDKDGNLYILLTLTGSFTSEAPWRGWCMKITPDGHMHPFASGFRSPGGIGFDCAGELWYSENQGPWNGADALRHITYKSFQGHPIGNKWYDLAPEMGPRPKDPQTNSRIYIEAEKIPQLEQPAIIQPYGKVGNSESGIVCDQSDGKFGPFAHQMFVADQSHSNIARFVTEKVQGKYQGVCIPFRDGFASGIVPMIQGVDGSLFVGGTSRGWGARGSKEFALERLVWTGKVPFEIYDMKIKPDGFDLTFTDPLDKALAGDAKNYNLSTFTYVYRADYGSPEVDQTTPAVKSATVGADGKSVHIVVDGLKIGSVHELHVPNLRNDKGEELLHPVAYYTLWKMP